MKNKSTLTTSEVRNICVYAIFNKNNVNVN